MQVRRATRADLPWVQGLVRGSFDQGLMPYLVAARAGIVRWWELVIEHPQSFKPTEFLVAVDKRGARLGFAEFRYSESGEGFLSYIAVEPAAQGKGVASGLMTSFFRSHSRLSSVELDVFESNAAARKLYDRLGFAQVARSSWWESELAPAPVPPGEVTIGDLHAVMARHAAYGFTDLELTTVHGRTRYGVLGEDVLRCFSEDSFGRADEHASLRCVFRGLRRRFIVVPGDDGPTGATRLVTSLRLRVTNISGPGGA